MKNRQWCPMISHGLIVNYFYFIFAASSQVNNTFEDLINGIVSEDYELDGEPVSNSVSIKSVESSVHFFLYTR